jgi:hypothetical protein
MSTKLNPGLYDAIKAALPDEPFFPLLARDESAQELVVAWAMGRLKAIKEGTKPDTDLPMIREALNCAADMVVWRKANCGSVGSGVAANTLPTWHDRKRGFVDHKAMVSELEKVSPRNYVLQKLDGETWANATEPGPLLVIAKLYNELLGQPPDNQEYIRSDFFRILPA